MGPNPATQFLNIYLRNTSEFDIRNSIFEIHDMHGKLITSFTCGRVPTSEGAGAGVTLMLDVESYTGGTYILSLLEDGVAVQSEKVVIA